MGMSISEVVNPKELRSAVEDYRGMCFWNMDEDFMPTNRWQVLFALDNLKRYGNMAAYRRTGGDQGVALTVFQGERLRLLAQNRIDNPESYVAGGLALNHWLDSPRVSRGRAIQGRRRGVAGGGGRGRGGLSRGDDRRRVAVRHRLAREARK